MLPFPTDWRNNSIDHPIAECDGMGKLNVYFTYNTDTWAHPGYNLGISKQPKPSLYSFSTEIDLPEDVPYSSRLPRTHRCS